MLNRACWTTVAIKGFGETGNLCSLHVQPPLAGAAPLENYARQVSFIPCEYWNNQHLAPSRKAGLLHLVQLSLLAK